MSQKSNFKYFTVIFILGALTIYFMEPIFVLLLIVTPTVYGFLKERSVSKKLEEVSLNLKEKKLETLALIEESNNKLRLLFNSIPSPLVYINQKGDFEVTNIYFDQLLKNLIVNVYDETIDPAIRNIFMEAYLNKQQFIKRITYQATDYQVRAIPMINNNKYNGCMLIFQDVTQIAEGEKMQKRFIADASHELKTPITSIMGMTEILNRSDFDDDITRTEFLLQIEKESKRLNHIVKDLLLQSRIRANKLYLDKVIFNLEQFFESLIYDLRQDLKESNIKVNLDCPSSIIVLGDQFRLSQVFLNLLNNSINYTKDGVINIKCNVYNNKVKIDISDNGKGIKEELLPHIFERFYRGEIDRNREAGGSGLGLAISKSIIEAHGGSIEVKSKLRFGTTFTVKLTQS